MKTTFDWKQLSKEQPEINKRIIIYSNRTGRVIWHIGIYNGFVTLGVKPNMYHYYDFDATKINTHSFTKLTKLNSQVLKADAYMCYWDYYNPYWKAPGTFDDMEEIFYK